MIVLLREDWYIGTNNTATTARNPPHLTSDYNITIKRNKPSKNSLRGEIEMEKKLYRSRTNAMLGGVCGGSGVLAYVIAAIIVPYAPA